jgi:DNA-binding response OmpR family regulator
VDDDASLRALVCDLLEHAGYETVEAESGREALDSAMSAPPALVVLDVAMPGLSGYEVCRSLRARVGDGLPILFVSGSRTEAYDRVAGLLLGGDDYLVKPFAPDELIARVRSLLRRAPAVVRSTSLTAREHEVLGLLAMGCNQHHIAGRLVISGKTVGTHIERILEKLGVHSRAEAVAVAYRDGIVSAPV